MGQEFNLLIVAAEDSSCLYAERLLEFWSEQEYKVNAFGVGSRKMESQGFDCIGRSEDLAVMGVQEVVKHWSVIKTTFRSIESRCRTHRPDAALLLDYPGFNLKLAKSLKKMGIKVIYYISPKVWAWKKGRIKTIKETVDKMFVIFPFEKDLYKSHDFNVEFLGHPLLDEIDAKFFEPEYTNSSRGRYGFGQNDHVVALMPGSRKAEIDHHLETHLNVARNLYKKNENLRFVLFVAPSLSKEYFQDRLPSLEFPLILVKDEPLEMIQLADSVLAASGTATLFVGLLARPMVIMYKMKAVTAFLAKLLVRSTKYFGIVNLILDKEVSRELFQEQASVENLTLEMEKVIFDTESRNTQIRELKGLMTSLGGVGATDKIGRSIVEFIESNK